MAFFAHRPCVRFVWLSYVLCLITDISLFGFDPRGQALSQWMMRGFGSIPKGEKGTLIILHDRCNPVLVVLPERPQASGGYATLPPFE